MAPCVCLLFLASEPPGPALLAWFEQETDREHRAITSSPWVNIIAPEILRHSGEIPIQIPFAKSFRYTNHMERLAEGRVVAR
jgi:hypothetical protein